MTILRALPWWALTVLSVLAFVHAGNFARSYLADLRVLDEAIAAAPAPVALHDLPGAGLTSPLNEIAVHDFGAAYTGTLGTRHAFLLVEAGGNPDLFVAFFAPYGAADEIDALFDRISADWDNHVVRGTVDRGRTLIRDDITELLADEGIAIDADNVLTAELILGDRADALRGIVQSDLLNAIITAIFAAAVGGGAVYKRRVARARRLALQPPPLPARA